jgi:proline iminopeptidase
MPASLESKQPAFREGYIPVGNAGLYYRETGSGQPMVILHGGPDFDHTYLLPDMDYLSDSCRLIYYDQRGRGRSAANFEPEDVTIQSEIGDMERLRMYFGLGSVAVLGHSWGGLLALEYAIRHPDRVSHLILLNSGPASHADYMLFRQERLRKSPRDVEKLEALASTPEYQEGSLTADADYYRIHFSSTLRQPGHLERVVNSLRLNFTSQGILKAREIEAWLMTETWSSEEYDLLPQLQQLKIPTLLIHGDYDLVPQECAEHIAHAIPGARLVLLKDAGHFSFLEFPAEVRREILRLLDSP